MVCGAASRCRSYAAAALRRTSIGVMRPGARVAFAAAASTGGLGKLLVLDEFEAWLCSTLSSCGGAGGAGGAVCFTFSEAREVFVPWGFARDLNFTQLLR